MNATASRPLPVVLFVVALIVAISLPLLAGQHSVAQEDPNPGADTSLVVETDLDLTDGERTWMTLHRPTIADDDPPIDAREGVLYAIDAPLMLLYDGQSRIDRIPQGEALVLREGDKVRPVAMQAGPASLLAVGLIAAGAPVNGDAYQPVGEPFALPAGSYVLELHRYDLTTRSGRTVRAIQQEIAALPYPALVYVEQGEVIATPAGQDSPATLKQHDLATLDGRAGLAVSDDGAVIVVVTLAPKSAQTVAGGTTTRGNADTAASGASSPTPGATSTATATATTEATVTATAAPDSDGDGLSDADEAARGTNPNSNDSDGDGVFDGFEVSIGLDPTRQDTDGDGISDYLEVPEEPVQGSGDADGDGLTDGYEEQVSLTNPNNADSDGDGLSDGQEINSYGTNPLNADTDGDGVNDGQEVNTYGSSPLSRDTDGDGLSDSFEVNQGTNPASTDTDGDGVDDGYETGRGMNPSSGDSDGDGLGDGQEVNTYGSNPLNPDSDGDERSDGYEVNCGQDPNTFTDYSDVVACG